MVYKVSVISEKTDKTSCYIDLVLIDEEKNEVVDQEYRVELTPIKKVMAAPREYVLNAAEQEFSETIDSIDEERGKNIAEPVTTAEKPSVPAEKNSDEVDFNIDELEEKFKGDNNGSIN